MIKKLSPPAVWHWIGGTEKISHKSPIIDNVRTAFELATVGKFSKRSGGATYPKLKNKIYGWHMLHATLREIEAPSEAAATIVGEPSTSSGESSEPAAKRARMQTDSDSE